jgi:flagellar hook-associated protein 1 FlgK
VSGLFGLLNLGSRSLSAAQFGQATAGNNAANAATKGYSRRRAQIVEGPTIRLETRVVGTGVRAVGLERLRHALLDTQWRLDSDDLNFAKAQAGITEQIQSLFSPAEDNAITSSLNQLFAAFGDVAARPEDAATRRVLLTQAQSFADALRLTRDKALNLESSTFLTIEDRVAEVGEVTGRLATVNVAIKASPDDPQLRDERDRLVDRLAELVGVRAVEQTDGTVLVTVAGTGVQLVDGPRAATVALTGVATTGTVAVTVDGNTLAAPGGEIGGLLRARNSTTDGLPYVLNALDQLASEVITAVNRVHVAGSGLTLPASLTGSVTVADPTALLNAAGLTPTPVAGTLTLGVFDSTGGFVSQGSVAVNPGTQSLNALAAAIDALPDVSASVAGGRLTISATAGANRLAIGSDSSDVLVALGVNGFFTGESASTIAVSPALVANPDLIAAARADLATGVVSPGDGRNAQALSALGRTNILAGNTQTAAGFLGTLGGVLGTVARSASARADTLGASLAATENQRQSVAGVNLDEELADMVRFQHAYEASAKFVQIIDGMIGTLLEIV